MKRKIKRLKIPTEDRGLTIAKRSKQKKYPAHYLAIALLVLMIFEFGVIGQTTASDWKSSLSLLDISGGISSTTSDLVIVFTPITDTINNINQFYQIAAVQMADLLNVGNSIDLTAFVDGVNGFYLQASTQMASLLDFSDSPLGSGNVAGTSVSR